jgi:hypothetical protein
MNDCFETLSTVAEGLLCRWCRSVKLEVAQSLAPSAFEFLQSPESRLSGLCFQVPSQLPVNQEEDT